MEDEELEDQVDDDWAQNSLVPAIVDVDADIIFNGHFGSVEKSSIPTEDRDEILSSEQDDHLKIGQRDFVLKDNSIGDVSLNASKKARFSRSHAIEPAEVSTDPLRWDVDDVFNYVSHQANIAHHATWLRNECVDGRALLLLNLSTLHVQLALPHRALLPLAHHLCKLKMAHLILRENNAV